MAAARMTAAPSVAHYCTSPLNSFSHRACKTDGVEQLSAVAPSAWCNGYTLLVMAVTAHLTVVGRVED